MVEENVIKEINNYIDTSFIDNNDYKECLTKINDLTF